MITKETFMLAWDLHGALTLLKDLVETLESGRDHTQILASARVKLDEYLSFWPLDPPQDDEMPPGVKEKHSLQ